MNESSDVEFFEFKRSTYLKLMGDSSKEIEMKLTHYKDKQRIGVSSVLINKICNMYKSIKSNDTIEGILSDLVKISHDLQLPRVFLFELLIHKGLIKRGHRNE